MSTIIVSFVNSTDFTLPGIPNTVSIETSEPATIFYTMDGSTPNSYSSVYVAPIIMPQNLLQVVITVFATNGIDNSDIITQTYTSSPSQSPFNNDNQRLPHTAVVNLDNSNLGDLFPFGSRTQGPEGQYVGAQNSGATTFNEALPATPLGFDANQNPDGYVNSNSILKQFKQIYSTTTNQGEIGIGIGSLPAKTTIIGKTTPLEYTQEQSNFADKLFNPKALVIFQDTTTEDPTNPVHINRPYFALEKQEIVRDGNLLYNTALDAPSVTGSFLKSYYNPRTNMITYYYYDNAVNRWIISSTPYQPTTKDTGAFYSMVFGRDGADAQVPHSGQRYFKWIWNQRRVLM